MKNVYIVFLLGIFSLPTIAQEKSYQPPADSHKIFIHYELGMHCTGFDLSYCCILPPYNSVLAEIVQTASQDNERPKILHEEDLKKENWVLWYEHEKNTFSEGPKMLYWNVPYDIDNNGSTSDPYDSFANYEFSQLYTYKEAPLRYKPEGAETKLYVGKDLHIPVDHGPTGKPISHDILDFTGEQGTIVYTELNDGSEIAIPLGQKNLWEALGLPLTAFYDGATPHIRAVREEWLRPYQAAWVSLRQWEDRNADENVNENELTAVKQKNGEPVKFVGTNPIDTPACTRCHSSYVANGKKFQKHQGEYDYWKNTYRNTSRYYARAKAASISMLELHDAHQGTDFLHNYNPQDQTGAAAVRLGRPPVKCQDCHGDNIIGVLKGKINEQTGKKIPPITVSVHLKHLRDMPEPDRHGRPGNCQLCHPAHFQSGTLEYYPADEFGRFKGVYTGDIREFWGGCFIGRDVHSNPRKEEQVGTQSHLNAVGTWLKKNVFQENLGLTCTNCHTLGSRLLYKADRLARYDQNGETLRNKAIEDIVKAFHQMQGGQYADFTVEDFFDPKVTPKNTVSAIWTDSWCEPYNQVDDAGDYWLSAGEPHCADCHKPPFVESLGGEYFPVDQEKKYSLMRYSKGHSKLACQSCHESMHGLHPVNPDGPDPTSFKQAK
ncbi:hypothetical protein GF373_14685, partial [bacterium]|nr:hypothetical protein [bacterium]